MKKIVVDKDGDSKKISTYLTSKYKGLNINYVYRALRQKDIKINSKRVSKDIKLSAGDVLEVYIADDLFEGKDLKDLDNKNIENINIEDYIQTVYEDENILLIKKNNNIEVVANDNRVTATTLLNSLGKYKYIYPCHRLDYGTSGLVIFAKSKKAEEFIRLVFENRDISKLYIAVVYGIVYNNDFRAREAYLFKDAKKSRVYVVDDLNKVDVKNKKAYVKIKTGYKMLKVSEKENISLLEVRLFTGKTHQIRAHLASLNYPIVGDSKYGKNIINRDFKKRYNVDTQLLCSYKLKFSNLDKDCYKNYKEFLYLANKEFSLDIPFMEYFN